MDKELAPGRSIGDMEINKHFFYFLRNYNESFISRETDKDIADNLWSKVWDSVGVSLYNSVFIFTDNVIKSYA
jgi:hypothetical protein